MVAKMFLPNGGIAIAAPKNKQSSKIGIRQTKGAFLSGAPILDGYAALWAAHSGTIGIVKIPVLQKFCKSFQRFRRMRSRGGRRCSAAGYGVFLDAFPEGVRNLNCHAAAFCIREKQGGKKICHGRNPQEKTFQQN
jgi:hypothetical protein